MSPPIFDAAMQISKPLPNLTQFPFSRQPLQLASRKPIQTLIIVDPCVEDKVALEQVANDGSETILLDNRQSGLEQITNVLVHCCQIQHLKILSSGGPGKLQLGSIWVDIPQLEAERALLCNWQQAFTSTTTILLHDYSIALGIEGMSFLGRFSQLTGATVGVAYPPHSSEWE